MKRTLAVTTPTDREIVMTRTFEARYVLDGTQSQAPLGATVSVRIPQGASPPSLQVPVGAVFDGGKGPGVWVVAGEPAAVTWRAVTIDGLGDDIARVRGALQRGERVVSLGAHLLREGQRVRTEPAAAASVAGVTP